MKRKYLIIFIVLILGVIVFLGGRLILNRRNQSANTSPTTKQPTNQNSQQGGPDTPGQPATPETGAPGAGASN